MSARVVEATVDSSYGVTRVDLRIESMKVDHRQQADVSIVPPEFRAALLAWLEATS